MVKLDFGLTPPVPPGTRKPFQTKKFLLLLQRQIQLQDQRIPNSSAEFFRDNLSLEISQTPGWNFPASHLSQDLNLILVSPPGALSSLQPPQQRKFLLFTRDSDPRYLLLIPSFPRDSQTPPPFLRSPNLSLAALAQPKEDFLPSHRLLNCPVRA